MDPTILVALAIGIGGPIIVGFFTWLGARLSRQSAKETNAVSQFTAFNAAQEARLVAAEAGLAAAEGRITELEKSDREKANTIANLTVIAAARSRYIAKLLRIITSHLPELESALIAPDPDDAVYITGVLGTDVPPENVG